MNLLSNIEPKSLLQFFYQLTQIPRPSKQEQYIIAYLKQFAAERSLCCKQDAAGNLLITKPATAGKELVPTVVLQSHVDMVCEKNADSNHDFLNDPLDLYIENGWLRARGTTLGADNGIGVAAQLAVLDAQDLSHGAIECLFTVDEETGLTGAFALEPGFFEGKILLNLDSEDDGEVYVGCAGGIGTTIEYPVVRDTTASDLFFFEVAIHGLRGGHSGGDIHMGLANANKLLGRFLWTLSQQMELRLVSIRGGNLHNAIPREASAVAAVPLALKEQVRVAVNIFQTHLEGEIGAIEPNFKIEMNSHLENIGSPWTAPCSQQFIQALHVAPHGVVAMSHDMEALVETSTNLASMKMTDADTVLIVTSQRSSIDSAKRDIAGVINSLFTLIGAKVTHSDGYPGWKPNLSSALLKVAISSYASLHGGKEPLIKAIHAGLECGLFVEKYPTLDMISFGPTMRGVHSPSEALELDTVEPFWKWLITILQNLD